LVLQDLRLLRTNDDLLRSPVAVLCLVRVSLALCLRRGISSLASGFGNSGSLIDPLGDLLVVDPRVGRFGGSVRGLPVLVRLGSVTGGSRLGSGVLAWGDVINLLRANDLPRCCLGSVNHHADGLGCLGNETRLNGNKPLTGFVVDCGLYSSLPCFGGVHLAVLVHHALVESSGNLFLCRLGGQQGKHQFVATHKANDLGDHVRWDAILRHHPVLAVPKFGNLFGWQHLLDSLKVQLELVIELHQFAVLGATLSGL